jgi:hypothetical protein
LLFYPHLVPDGTENEKMNESGAAMGAASLKFSGKGVAIFNRQK